MDDVLRDIKARAEVRALVQELSALTGVSEEHAVLVALEERVARLEGAGLARERIGRALATLRARPRNPPAMASCPANSIAIARWATAGRAYDAGRDGAAGHPAARGRVGAPRGAGDKAGNARVPATALAEAGMVLAAEGSMLDVLDLDQIVRTLTLTVVPFTEADWSAAVREYHGRRRSGERDAARFGECLTAAVAARTGAEVVSVQDE